ncbi:serine/threonine-protein kinase [Microcoleus sp. N9_B2]|uniref:serine/threonine-protein kinase n=1 Tax=unclassified Microcoleus TaxID=2642155 RepID=UPI002FD14441
METLEQSEKIIAERYRIIGKLGQGGVGITYAAVDLNSNQKVALKALSLRLTTEWKKIELFEREAKTLSGLNHPGIPRYIDYFQVDTSQDRCFYIAQQLAPVKSLAQWIENGWKPNEAQVRHIAYQLLEILAYLQSLLPPAIHRDIKPQNIILQKNGRVFLVDFGAVQNTYHHTVTGGSTVVGTYGYMAPEQFRGKAVLSTDLYGLGTTLLFLLTQKFPSDLPREKLKVKFREIVSISTEFADWLEKIIEPAIEDRFHSAKDALSALRGEQPKGINPEKCLSDRPNPELR